ncbi:MAG: hypothetical protein EXS36_04455 [Pedosphaera sp.]|nr:hypothetical protein [Pedosphaera sp.]
MNLVFLARMLVADIARLDAVFLGLCESVEKQKADGADASGFDRQAGMVFQESEAKRTALRRALLRMERVAKAAP